MPVTVPAVAVDHVFICADAGAPESQHLIDLGLVEGPPNTHPGQGTANRRFFFRSTMIELLWVANPEEARSSPAARMLLWERWSGRRSGACPFGIILRPESETAPPFAGWEYRPAYLPAGQAMHIAAAGIHEPMWVYAPFLETPSRLVEHAAGFRDITRVRLTTPAEEDSRVGRAMADLGIVCLRSGPAHLLELEFDGARKSMDADFRPVLPLAIRW